MGKHTGKSSTHPHSGWRRGRGDFSGATGGEEAVPTVTGSWTRDGREKPVRCDFHEVNSGYG